MGEDRRRLNVSLWSRSSQCIRLGRPDAALVRTGGTSSELSGLCRDYFSRVTTNERCSFVMDFHMAEVFFWECCGLVLDVGGRRGGFAVGCPLGLSLQGSAAAADDVHPPGPGEV